MSIYKSGKDIVSLFYALVKATLVYDLKNDVVQNAAKKFIDYLNNLFQTISHIELLRYRDYIFFNKMRLRFELEGYASLQFIDENFKALKIKSLNILPGITQDEITQFAAIFRGDKESFLDNYNLYKLKSIHIQFTTGDEEIPDFFKDGERIKKTYFKALKVTKNLIQDLWVKQPVDVKSFRRIVYTLIDNLSQDEFGLIALTTIKNFDEYTFNHSLNVGILALAMGQRIGLEKKNLVKLGTAGLLHDIGKVEISKELIYKAASLSNEEWEALKSHSLYGVKEIIKTRGLDETAISAIITTYQHHLNYDGTGYPMIGDEREKPMFHPRIIRICDAYDAMTTARPYQPVPYLPPLAMRVLWARKTTYFDPILVKIFIQLLGLYPVGSCLNLDSGEIGLVIRQNPGYLDLPVVKIIVNRDKERVDGRVIDLSLNKEIKILTPIYPQKYGINPASYFV